MVRDASHDQSELLTAAELARRLGVAQSTIWNWTKRKCNPLKTTQTADKTTCFTWIQLEEFCRANPGLRGVARYRQQAIHQGQLPTATTAIAGLQVEDLRSMARDLRNAANESVQMALEAARLSEETARSHRVQLEHLAKVIAAYDTALSSITAPSTLND